MTSRAALDPRVAAVAARAPLAHVAVETRSGPHLTPVLHAPAAGAVWFLVPRGTLKAKVLRVRPRAGVLLRAGEDSVVAAGPVRLLDPFEPSVAALAKSGLAPLAIGTYSLRNPRELAGFALDALLDPGTASANLVLAALEPDRGALVRGETVRAKWGHWPAASRQRRARGPVEPPPLPDAPDAVADLLEDDGPAALGWMTDDGPLALPAEWDATGHRASVPRALLRLSGGAPSAAACLTLDVTDASRPTGKRGVMLRGTGRVSAGGGASDWVSIDADSVTHWDGFETGTQAAVA